MTDAELDALQKRLDAPPFGTETSERLLFGAAFDAITHLRTRLAERDDLGAVVMRERAAKACEVIEEVLRQGYAATSANAVGEAYCSIRAIPLPTHAELLAHALTLPEIKALETELKLRREIAALERLCDHDCDNEDCVRCFHYPDILEQRRAALAQMEGRE